MLATFKIFFYRDIQREIIMGQHMRGQERSRMIATLERHEEFAYQLCRIISRSVFILLRALLDMDA